MIHEVASGASKARSERGPSAWAHPLEEGAIRFAGFDHGVKSAAHLRGDGGVSLATQIGIVAVLRDVPLELVAEAVGRLQGCGLSGDPERAAETGVAVRRYLAPTAELAGVMVAGSVPQNFRN